MTASLPPLLPALGRRGRCTLALTKHLWSDEVERLTGVAARNLGQEVARAAVAGVMQAYGWSLRSVKELGERGKRRALVRVAFPVAAE